MTMTRTERRFIIDCFKKATLQTLRHRCHREPCLVDPRGRFSVGDRIITRVTHNGKRNRYHQSCWDGLFI